MTGVRGKGASETFQCSWLPLEDVLAAIGSAAAPVTLVLRRGGAEPWMCAGLALRDCYIAVARAFTPNSHLPSKFDRMSQTNKRVDISWISRESSRAERCSCGQTGMQRKERFGS